jgi:hypothetical protein
MGKKKVLVDLEHLEGATRSGLVIAGSFSCSRIALHEWNIMAVAISRLLSNNLQSRSFLPSLSNCLLS